MTASADATIDLSVYRRNASTIHETLLRSWKLTLETQGGQAFPGHGKLPPFEEELRHLRAENKRLRAERDI
jgi:transposase